MSSYVDYPTSALIITRKKSKKRGRKRKRTSEIDSDDSGALVVYENNTTISERPKVVSFNESPQIFQYEMIDSEEMGAGTESAEQMIDGQGDKNTTNSSSSNSSRDFKNQSGSENIESDDGTHSDYDPLSGETNIEMINEINDGIKLIDDGNC